MTLNPQPSTLNPQASSLKPQAFRICIRGLSGLGLPLFLLPSVVDPYRP